MAKAEGGEREGKRGKRGKSAELVCAEMLN